MKHKKFKHVAFDHIKRVFHLQYTSFYFVSESGEKDYVPYDKPLHIAQVPEYAKEQALYKMTKAINEFIRKEKVPKRELARRLHTSTSQLTRLLDPTNHKKELSRLIEIAALLNYEFKWEFKKAI